jgi:hypothetical protein
MLPEAELYCIEEQRARLTSKIGVEPGDHDWLITFLLHVEARLRVLVWQSRSSPRMMSRPPDWKEQTTTGM